MMSEAIQKFDFPRTLRVTSSEEFERVYAGKTRVSDSVMLMFAVRNGLSHPRLGMSVSRRHGNSVIRHRIKRQMREAFRLLQHKIPAGIDYVLIPGRGALAASQLDYQNSLEKLSSKVVLKLHAEASSQPE